MAFKDYLTRLWTWYFKAGGKDEMLESFKQRKGSCKQCGKCCKFFGIKCIFLSKDNKCRIYNWRPFVLCNIAPLEIFENHWEEHKKLNCGYT